MKTKVIYRILEGEVLALFPELPGDYNPATTCLSYMHIGKHGAATTDITGRRLATPAEYASLHAELTSIGYDLKIAHRFTPADFRSRKAAIEAVA